MPQTLTEQLSREQQIAALEKDWATNPRWKGIKRGYSAADVVRLRGSFPIEHTLARRGAEKLWELVNNEPYVNCLGALTGGQAMQQVKAGVKAIYLSGWQVAADANTYSSMYPDQSLYPVDSVPTVVERINNTFRRADEIQWSKNVNPGDKGYVDYFAPIVADAEAGFGGVLNGFELMKAMIKAGAGGVHFEDQLASVKKCGHMGGKVLVPTTEAVQKLVAARMAADVCGTPTLVIARTDAEAADLITSDVRRDRQALLHRRAHRGRLLPDEEGLRPGHQPRRGLRDYADLMWCETGTPGPEFARKDFAEAVHKLHPGKMLAYNCSPSFNWKKNLDDATIAKFQKELGAMGYKFQFITLAGFHSMWFNMFELAKTMWRSGMSRLRREGAAARVRSARQGATPSSSTSARWAPVTSMPCDHRVIQGGKGSSVFEERKRLTGSTEEEQVFH
jgi:isocitrate lyase